MSPLRYDLRFYIPEDGILHSHRRENLKSSLFSHVFHLPTFLFPRIAAEPRDERDRGTAGQGQTNKYATDAMDELSQLSYVTKTLRYLDLELSAINAVFACVTECNKL
jgi:hypothetical protein